MRHLGGVVEHAPQEDHGFLAGNDDDVSVAQHKLGTAALAQSFVEGQGNGVCAGLGFHGNLHGVVVIR